jgi:uncharacterized protein YigE (DUF2233 family)
MKNIYWLVLLLVLLNTDIVNGQEDLWKKVDEGLFMMDFDSPQKSPVGDSKITILKINPNFYSFKLICASEQGGKRMTAKEWCKKYKLIAAVNAGMFQADGIKNVGYMKNFNHVNNPRLNSYKAVLVFNPVGPGVPDIQIIDLKCQNFGELRYKYQTFIQNIRMLSCQQKNVWSKENKAWSMVVLGVDKTGNVLFIFTRSPYSVHDFINILLSLPISIYNAMYLEGGPMATLYFSANGIEGEKYGSFETVFKEDDNNTVAWPLPNVIGIVKK